jgi:PIN domain nuclease of toxin-antitoxin system
VRLLLDTHVLIWWLRDDPRLGPKARALMADNESEVLFSLVSCWEASVKVRVGKMDVSGAELWQFAIGEGIQPIGLTSIHIEELDRLTIVPGHRDPFDHLLLVQAKVAKAALVTHDRALPQYGVPCIGVR